MKLRVNSSGIRYSNMVPLQDSSVLASVRGGQGRLSANQCSTGTSPLAMATRLARRHSLASKIVVAVEFQRPAHGIADAEQAALGIVEEPHIHLLGKAVGEFPEQAHALDGGDGVGLGLGIFGGQLVEPGSDFGADLRRASPGQDRFERPGGAFGER